MKSSRVAIRQFNLNDADYILRQLNDKAFIRFITDKKVRDLAAAEKYLRDGPLASYREHGFGLNLVVDSVSCTPMGMCGLIKRDELDLPDLGYAFLPQFWGKGFAQEACELVLKQAKEQLNLKNIVAVTMPDNDASIRLLKKLNFSLKGTISLYGSNNFYFELSL